MKKLQFLGTFIVVFSALVSSAKAETYYLSHENSDVEKSAILQPSGKPDLRSTAVLISDAEGRVIYGKNTDEVRPIASITKLVTAMVVLDKQLDLKEKITITKDDRDLIRLTGSRLEVGARLTREELLVLAIMASENRAALALGRTYPGGMEAFVRAMNQKTQQLGMTRSHFADPAGLSAENVSTAADLAILIKAASEYPLIQLASTTTQKEVYPFPRRGELRYANTNRLLKNKSWEILLSKTGYINEAGRCLVMRATIAGQPISIVLLDSFGKLTPFGDSNRLRRWLTSSS